MKWMLVLLLLALVIGILLRRFLSDEAPPTREPSPRSAEAQTVSAVSEEQPPKEVGVNICQALLDRARPVGLLAGVSAETLRTAIEYDDEELGDFFADDPTGCLTEAVAHQDPNSLFNSTEKAEGVARWQPPLIRHLGFRGTYDWSRQTVTFHRADQQVLEAKAVFPCHVAEAWNQILKSHGYEMLNLDLGTDDHYFLVVPLEAGERIRKEQILRLARSCPRE